MTNIRDFFRYIMGNQSLSKRERTRQALNYPISLTCDDFLALYIRQDMAKRVVDLPINDTWSTDPEIIEDEIKETQFEIDVVNLFIDFDIINICRRADTLSSIGRFSILFLGFSDSNRWDMPPAKDAKLLYIQPYLERDVLVGPIETNPKNKRFGYPKNYTINTGNNGETFIVDSSRVIHIVDNAFDNVLYAIPKLQPIYNRLLDLEQLAGGSAEMFWRGARPGYVASLKDGAMIPDDETVEQWRTQIDEFEHDLRRWLRVGQVDVQSLQTQFSSPTDAVNVQVQLIAAASGIPQRILIGSERGELASSQDETRWRLYIMKRREIFANNIILYPLIDRLIEFGIISTPENDYAIRWDSKWILSPSEQAEISEKRINSLTNYIDTPGADILYPPELFLERDMGLMPEQIKKIESINRDIYKSDVVE